MDTAEEIVTPGAAASAFKNPSMLAALQGRLDTLVGAPSEYIQSLPGEVHRRLDALKNLQDEGNVFNVQFRKEVEELEKKYLKLAIPLYKKRTDIITGAVEPTDSEVERKPDEEEEEEERLPVSKENPVKGIPEFWLTALKNMRYISELITEDDEPALAKLVDIKLSYLSSPGFQLSFVFDNNDYFTNSVLTKAYYMMESEDPSVDEVMFDRAEGCEIDWKAGKDLSVTIEVKKQRHKATNKTRTVKKAVPKETFFSFFSPPAPPTEEDEDDEEKFDEYDERIQIDYEIGEMIKDKLIPKAVDWFTGKALEYEDHDEDDYDDEFDGEDDEDDEDEEDDDHVGPSKKTIGSKSNAASVSIGFVCVDSRLVWMFGI
ncbi:hypothetical protein BDEG_27303 [Batrachochytrium dendrobatidis JEL423]|uniref:Nucleosome assembly protein n=1 Tax=Batrachochytrium dendrobatidis (strain JEL423) TaxID=403673 RepID=A0A177WWX8_BATDL|nr:hypothetical protein BDEG_27303 [Batrachochytrium dendrobatidis JEL423]